MEKTYLAFSQEDIPVGIFRTKEEAEKQHCGRSPDSPVAVEVSGELDVTQVYYLFIEWGADDGSDYYGVFKTRELLSEDMTERDILTAHRKNLEEIFDGNEESIPLMVEEFEKEFNSDKKMGTQLEVTPSIAVGVIPVR